MILIHFKVPVDEAVARIMKRERGIPNNWINVNSPAEIKNYITKYDNAIDKVVSCLRAEGMKVITVDSMKDAEETREEILEIIHPIFDKKTCC